MAAKLLVQGISANSQRKDIQAQTLLRDLRSRLHTL
jgi:hypothetical protein